MEHKEFGTAQYAGNSSVHPEVSKRKKEIMLIARNLTPEEIEFAIWNYSATKWHRLNTATIDFKPESKGEENK